MHKILFTSALIGLVSTSIFAGGPVNQPSYPHKTITPSLQDTDGFYMTAAVGAGLPAGSFSDHADSIAPLSGTSFKPSNAIAADLAIGYQYCHFRLEGQFFFLQNGIKGNISGMNVHWQSQMYMANLTYNLNLFNHIGLYAGGGLGLNNFNFDTDGVGANSARTVGNYIAYQAIAGLTVGITENLYIGAEYHFVGSSIQNSTLINNVINGVVTYKFY